MSIQNLVIGKSYLWAEYGYAEVILKSKIDGHFVCYFPETQKYSIESKQKLQYKLISMNLDFIKQRKEKISKNIEVCTNKLNVELKTEYEDKIKDFGDIKKRLSIEFNRLTKLENDADE